MRTYSPRTATLRYTIKGSKLVFVFDEYGDLIDFKINGIDRSENGDAIENALIAVLDAGYHLQTDLSVALEASVVKELSAHVSG